jgi:predicted NUDIX family phosphoesterase
LVVGGHVDRPSKETEITSLLVDTLSREIEEEIGHQGLIAVDPIGLVIDPSSIFASRHVAIVYQVVIRGRVAPQAKEEFSTRSKFSGRFFTGSELSRFHEQFDPWSLILFEDYIAPLHPRQFALSFHLPD